jgi:hypothetical protein
VIRPPHRPSGARSHSSRRLHDKKSLSRSLAFRLSTTILRLQARLALDRQLSAVNSPVSPFLAALTQGSQIIENSATLSLLFATLARSVTRKSFVCHSYRKSPGVGGKPSKPADLHIFQPPSFHVISLHLFFCIFLHFSALAHLPNPFSSTTSTFFAQNTWGGRAQVSRNSVIPSTARDLLFPSRHSPTAFLLHSSPERTT